MRLLLLLFNLVRHRSGISQSLIAMCFLSLMESTAMAEAEVFAGERQATTEARQTIGLSSGAGLGSFIFGGSIKHDFAFLNFHYGRVLLDPIGENSWWEGKWLILGEATVGREISPGDAWSASLTPVGRYLFGYPRSIVPFLEVGFGFTWTDIGEPDLGGEFQFNSQGGGGFYWFARPNLALTLQYRFVHYSSAGLTRPNGGVNIHSAMIGVSYFY